VEGQELAQPHLQQLRDTVDDSTSLAALDGSDVIHVCYVPSRRRYRCTVTNGSREAAPASAPGRAILAHLDPAGLEEFMSRTRLEARTDRTETSEAGFREILGEVRRCGYAVVVDELEYGITGIAVPVFDGAAVVGAVGCTTPSGYLTEKELVATRLPALQTAAGRIAEELSRFPAFSHSVRWS
jgi:IclR family transcriptional regulator, pca regulon regulatory protein